MNINIGTVKEPRHVFVEWLSKEAIHVCLNDIAHDELRAFLMQQLQKKCIADLRKADNPSEAAKTWKPVFGKKKKSKVEKLAETIKKLSASDQNELKGLL